MPNFISLDSEGDSQIGEQNNNNNRMRMRIDLLTFDVCLRLRVTSLRAALMSRVVSLSTTSNFESWGALVVAFKEAVRRAANVETLFSLLLLLVRRGERRTVMVWRCDRRWLCVVREFMRRKVNERQRAK